MGFYLFPDRKGNLVSRHPNMLLPNTHVPTAEMYTNAHPLWAVRMNPGKSRQPINTEDKTGKKIEHKGQIIMTEGI